jgi:hypothetical protein
MSNTELMPYALTDVFTALQTLIERFEEGESISPDDYARAKNAIAYAQGEPLPFLERKRLDDKSKKKKTETVTNNSDLNQCH